MHVIVHGPRAIEKEPNCLADRILVVPCSDDNIAVCFIGITLDYGLVDGVMNLFTIWSPYAYINHSLVQQFFCSRINQTDVELRSIKHQEQDKMSARRLNQCWKIGQGICC